MTTPPTPPPTDTTHLDPSWLQSPSEDDWAQARQELARAAMVRRFNQHDRAPAEPIQRVLDAIDSFLPRLPPPDPEPEPTGLPNTPGEA